MGLESQSAITADVADASNRSESSWAVLSGPRPQ